MGAIRTTLEACDAYRPSTSMTYVGSPSVTWTWDRCGGTRQERTPGGGSTQVAGVAAPVSEVAEQTDIVLRSWRLIGDQSGLLETAKLT